MASANKLSELIEAFKNYNKDEWIKIQTDPTRISNYYKMPDKDIDDAINEMKLIQQEKQSGVGTKEYNDKLLNALKDKLIKEGKVFPVYKNITENTNNTTNVKPLDMYGRNNNLSQMIQLSADTLNDANKTRAKEIIQNNNNNAFGSNQNESVNDALQGKYNNYYVIPQSEYENNYKNLGYQAVPIQATGSYIIKVPKKDTEVKDNYNTKIVQNGYGFKKDNSPNTQIDKNYLKYKDTVNNSGSSMPDFMGQEYIRALMGENKDYDFTSPTGTGVYNPVAEGFTEGFAKGANRALSSAANVTDLNTRVLPQLEQLTGSKYRKVKDEIYTQRDKDLQKAQYDYDSKLAEYGYDSTKNDFTKLPAGITKESAYGELNELKNKIDMAKNNLTNPQAYNDSDYEGSLNTPLGSISLGGYKYDPYASMRMKYEADMQRLQAIEGLKSQSRILVQELRNAQSDKNSIRYNEAQQAIAELRAKSPQVNDFINLLLNQK